MNWPQLRVDPNRLRAWLERLVFFLLLPTLAAIALAGVTLITSPWDGIEWAYPDYEVLSIVPGSPAEVAGIHLGDHIVAVDGVPPSARFPIYPTKLSGPVLVAVERQGQVLNLPLTLTRMPGSELALPLLDLSLALLFSVLSFAFTVGRREAWTSLSFVLFYQLLATAIATGSVSGLQVAWAAKGFYVCQALIVPAFLFMALNFPVPRRERRWLSVVHGSAVLGGGLALICVLVPPSQLLPLLNAGLRRAIMVALLVSVTGGLLIVLQSYRQAKDAISRSAFRVSALGLGLSLLPFVFVYLIPRAVFGHWLVPAEAALLSLAVLPVYHGFAITRRRFGGLERILPPVSSAVISGIVIIGTLLLTTWLARAIWRGGGEAALWAGMLVGGVVLAAANATLISGARRVVQHAFYGQSYDYQSIVSEMSRDLTQAVGRKQLGDLVVGLLCRRMSITGAALLSSPAAGAPLAHEASSGSLSGFAVGLSLGPDSTVVRRLAELAAPQRRESFLAGLTGQPLDLSEEQLLADERVALWVPVIMRGSLRAVLVLGSKLKDALFSHEDLEIVATLAGQIGVSMENADLYDDLRAEMRKLQEMQDQLVQAEKLSAVGELVSGVAHELNNPLTAVMGYAELLRGEVSDPQCQRDIDNILRCAERSRRIVRNLLTFARRQKTERQMVDINEIVRQTVELQTYQMRVDNVAVELELDPDLPPTAADASQIQQVFINIIMNAHQAIKGYRQQGTIRVITRALNDTIRVSIADDGPGIPPEVMARIFDPFFTTKEVGVGTGLGLSICYGIVRGHDGRIWCESQPGMGATFHIELPVTRVQVQKEPPAQAAPLKAGLHVLIVEDEVAVSAVLQRLLAKRGCSVEAASGGQEALLKARAAEYDVVFSDIKMPGMNGMAFWQKLRESKPELARRVIFVTGDTASPETSEFLREAGQPVLPKPFGTDELAKAIAELETRLGATETT